MERCWLWSVWSAKSMITMHKAQNIIFISTTVMHPIYLWHRPLSRCLHCKWVLKQHRVKHQTVNWYWSVLTQHQRTCSLKKDEHLYFITRGLLYHIPTFIVPAQEFYPWYVAPYQLIVPKLKSILFNFYNIAWLLVKATLAWIPSDLKNHRITILLRLVTYLQTHKQVFSIFVHKNRDFEASNSLIWRFYEARFWENKKNPIYFFRRWFEKITCG